MSWEMLMLRVLTLLLGVLSASAVLAQSTYRWVDESGKVRYSDRPPAAKGVRDVEERKVGLPTPDAQLPFETRQAMNQFPVTLYVTADCTEPCKLGRDYLGKRNIPFAEKVLASAAEKAALRDKLGGGDFGVPLLMVGNKSSKGFLESSWAGLLDAAGYPKAANP
jgi:hypothetical protein